MYPFCVHLKFRNHSDEYVYVSAEDPQEAIIMTLKYFRSGDGSNSTRRWVETVEAHWLHTQVPGNEHERQ